MRVPPGRGSLICAGRTAALAASALVAMAQPAVARPSPSQTPPANAANSVVRAGDDGLTCGQMADEAATLSAGMGENGPGLLGRAAGVARAGAALLVPGAGLAMAGADALTSSGKDRREAEVDAKRDRWNYLNGLYAGRSCGEPAAEAAAVPAVAPTANAAPAVPAPPAPTITLAVFPH